MAEATIRDHGTVSEVTCGTAAGAYFNIVDICPSDSDSHLADGSDAHGPAVCGGASEPGRPGIRGRQPGLPR